MPKKEDIKKVIVIGSGPIIIGQAAEFDYAGSQACRALKEEGLEVVLVNSNPATIMTDTHMADRVYIEPLTVEFMEEIISKERPDGLLATLGGQAGLNLAVKLSEQGILEKYNVELLGTSLEAIERAEDRELFKETMNKLGEPIPESTIVEDVASAVAFAHEIGYPLIVRPAYTMGGTGGGIAESEDELIDIVIKGLKYSMIGQVLIERSVAGWKEIEYEVMRDGNDNCITCQTYPRKLLMLGECQLRSLSMTCPIAADMALFSDNGLAMVVQQLGNEHNNGWKILLQNEQKKKGINATLAETIIIASMSILQNTAFSREERFILLSLFLDKADDLKTSENAAEQILNLAIIYQSESFISEARTILSSFHFLVDDNKKFMHELLSMIAANNQIGALNTLLKQAEDYTEDYDKWQVSLENEYGRAMDNYWLHEFFYLGYPFHLEGNFMHNYFVFLLSYKVWEIVLYGYLHVLGRIMTKEEFINLVGTYSKIMDHRQKFLPVIEKKAAECEGEPIKAMQMLLRLR